MSGKSSLRQSWPVLAAFLAIGFTADASAQAPREESAQQNVRESEQYEHLLCSNPGFRNQRIQRECGSIDDPQMHEQCVSSFQCKSGEGEGGAPPRRRRAPHG